MAKMNEKQLLLTVGGAGVVLAILGGVGIWWSQGLVEEERTQIEQIQGEIAAAEAQIAKIPEIEADVITLRENVDEYVKILPEDEYITSFVRRTEEFMSHAEVTMINFIPTPPAKRGKFDQYTYKIQVEATLWQFMRFINQFENYERFVRVKEFTLQGGDSGRSSSKSATGEVRHTINMVVETFVYRGGTASKNVNIPNYASKRERLRERILANALSIKLRRYEFKDSQSRRDIFTDPRQKDGPDSTNPIEKQREVITKFTEQVRALQEINDRMQSEGLTYLERAKLNKELQSQLKVVRQEFIAAEENQLITWAPFKLTWTKDVARPLDELERQKQNVTGSQENRWLSEEQLTETLGDMRTAMAEGDFDDVREQYQTLRSQFIEDPEDPRFPIVERIEMLMLYVDAVSDFSAIPLDISGVVVQGDGRSGLLVNDRVMEEGEYVNDELVLKSVQAESAEFLFRGFVIVKNW